MPRLSFEPIAPLWVIALMMIAMVAVLWFGPAFAKVTGRKRRTLLWLRGLVLFLALLALLRPGLVSSIRQQQSAVVAIMLDFSRSMKLPHLATGPSRWESMRKLFLDNADKIREIEKQNIDVRFYGFGTELTEFKFNRGKPDWPDEPFAGETDLGSPLYDIFDSARNERLLAIVVGSDGVQNVTDPEVELIQAAKALADSQVPLYTVPFGQTADTNQFADIAIEKMPDQYTVWVKNDLTVSATLTARGFANQDIPVQLVVIDSTGKEEIVDTLRQPIAGQNESVRVNLQYAPQAAGQYRLLVRAEPQPGEISPQNNQLPAFLTVNEGGLRVLMLYGSLGWEQRFLQESIASYQDVELDTRFIDSGRRDQWPLDLTHLFGDPQYDVFILCDVDSRALHETGIQERNLTLLADAVSRGKGLMMTGGYHSFGAGVYHRTPLNDILPIEMQRREQQDFDAPIRGDLHIQEDLTVIPTTNHFVTRLGDVDENMELWRSLPPLAGGNRFLGIKPSAGVLLTSTSQHDVLVAVVVGGRVLALNTDSTWKWWMHGHKELHKRFWRQVILWLAFRDGLEGENVWIDLPQRRFEPNVPIDFLVGANTMADQAIADVTFSGRLVGPDGETSALGMTRDGEYSRSQVPRSELQKPGIYTIEVAANRDGESMGTAKAEFVVFDNDKEQANPGADPLQLSRLADQTANWGGRMVEPQDVDKLLDQLAGLSPEMKIEVPKKWQLGDTWIDALAFILIFVGLISSEWFFRKKWGLV